jgi:hypothetical protein
MRNESEILVSRQISCIENLRGNRKQKNVFWEKRKSAHQNIFPGPHSGTMISWENEKIANSRKSREIISKISQIPLKPCSAQFLSLQFSQDIKKIKLKLTNLHIQNREIIQ